MKHRIKFVISYRVLDEDNNTLAVIKESGYNKNHIEWSVNRKVKHKFGKEARTKKLKIVEIED